MNLGFNSKYVIKQVPIKNHTCIVFLKARGTYAHIIILVSSTRPQVIEQSLKLEVISVQSIRQVVAAQISLFKIVPCGGTTGITEITRICLSKKR